VVNASSQHASEQTETAVRGRTPRIISGRFSILYIVLRIFPFLFGTWGRGEEGNGLFCFKLFLLTAWYLLTAWEIYCKHWPPCLHLA